MRCATSIYDGAKNAQKMRQNLVSQKFTLDYHRNSKFMDSVLLTSKAIINVLSLILSLLLPLSTTSLFCMKVAWFFLNNLLINSYSYLHFIRRGQETDVLFFFVRERQGMHLCWNLRVSKMSISQLIIIRLLQRSLITHKNASFFFK